MSQQPQRQLSKEESDLIKARTRNENLSSFWHGFRIFIIIGIIGSVAVCGIVICVAMANPPR